MKYLALIFLTLFIHCGFADELNWENLNASQQAQLAKFQSRWDEIPLARREKIVKGLSQWQQMSEAKTAR